MENDPTCLCKDRGQRLCPKHQPLFDDEPTAEVETRELLPYDEVDAEPTLRDGESQGARLWN